MPLRYAFNPEKSDIVSIDYSPARGWKAKKKEEDEWGCVWDVIPDFIEIGVNAFNFNQPRIFDLQGISGIDRLAETFGGKVCFICPIDMQRTLIEGTSQDIRAEARCLVERLGRTRL